MGFKQTLSHITLLVGLGGSYLACTSAPPLQDYTLARTALDAARRTEAARYAPAYFHRAEEAYRRGETAFKERDFSSAEKDFQTARTYAEKAENVARIQRVTGGG